MDQGRAVNQLDRDGGPDEPLTLGRRHAGRHAHQQWAQPLAAGGDRLAGKPGQHRSVPRGQLGHPLFDPIHQPSDGGAADVDHRLDRLGRHRTTPTCSAMIPPAVTR